MNYNTEIPSIIAALHSYNEYRGLSYGIGGDVNASTVPNYIKHFQPNVTGYSIGKHLGEYCNGKLTKENRIYFGAKIHFFVFFIADNCRANCKVSYI
jgi:hypothetical protein